MRALRGGEAPGVANGQRHHRALRVDAGRGGQQRGVVDPHVCRAVHPTERVRTALGRGLRPSAPSSTGGRSSRWLCAAEKLDCIVARSLRLRTTGAPRNDGYTSSAPASSITSASRASPLPSRARSRAGQAVGHDRIAKPAHRSHLAAALAGDRRVVHADPSPVGDGVGERATTGRSAPARRDRAGSPSRRTTGRGRTP